jgi:hypothetical protein
MEYTFARPLKHSFRYPSLFASEQLQRSPSFCTRIKSSHLVHATPVHKSRGRGVDNLPSIYVNFTDEQAGKLLQFWGTEKRFNAYLNAFWSADFDAGPMLKKERKKAGLPYSGSSFKDGDKRCRKKNLTTLCITGQHKNILNDTTIRAVALWQILPDFT